MKPLAIDLYCGLGGWTEGFLAEGYEVIGFDIEQRPYPAQLVIQDVLTLHGSQFKNATIIVASPPCQAYSYRAMPWKRAKALGPPSNELFDACFRIQREASEAAGRYIPLVVENVCGAQPWVGRAKWHFGSYYLWGDVPALMPITTLRNAMKVGDVGWRRDGKGNSNHCFQGAAADALKVPGLNWSGSDKPGYVARAFNTTAEQRLATKNNGGSWFNVAHNTESGVGQNPDGRKVPVYSDPRRNGGKGAHLTNPSENLERLGVKQPGRAWFADPDVAGHFSSKGSARAAASAQIAKIPFELARYIASVFKPEGESKEAASG